MTTQMNVGDAITHLLKEPCDISKTLFGIINVKCFGANGIGSNPEKDTEAIQKALKSVTKRGVVYLPAGTYTLTSALALPSNVELRGAGPGLTTLRLHNDARTDMITNADHESGNSNITISNLVLDGNKANNSRKAINPGGENLQGTWDQAGIHWVKVSDSKIINCSIHDCAWNGIVMSGGRNNDILNCCSDYNGNVQVGPFGWGQFEAFGILLWAEKAGEEGANKNNRIVSCTAKGNEKHGIEILGDFHKNNLITGCFAINNNGYGIMINAFGSTHAGSIIGCTCMENGEGGVGIIGEDIIVDGNFLTHNNHCAFRGFIGEPPKVSGGSLVVAGNRCNVSNNIVRDALPTTSGNSVDGIAINGDNNRIMGNLIVKTYNRGIGFGGNSNVVVGNTIAEAGVGASSSGIQGNESTGATVEANVITNSSLTGILFNGPGGGHRIAMNHVDNNGWSGIVLENQTDCIIEGNTCVSNGTKAATSTAKTGISLTGETLRTIVNGNRCGNRPMQAPTQDFGILMAGASNKTLISGNIVLDNNIQSMSLVGAGNVIGPNMQ